MNRAEPAQDGIDISASCKSLSNDSGWFRGPAGGPIVKRWSPPRPQNHTLLRRIGMAGSRMHCTAELGMICTYGMANEATTPVSASPSLRDGLGPRQARRGSTGGSIIRSGRQYSAILSDSQGFSGPLVRLAIPATWGKDAEGYTAQAGRTASLNAPALRRLRGVIWLAGCAGGCIRGLARESREITEVVAFGP